jgi:hypothetical protein
MPNSLALRPIQRALLPLLAASALLAGCAGNPLRSYDKELGETLSYVRSGNVNGALALLEKNNPPSSSKKKDSEGKDDAASGRDILYYFEKGQLLRLNNEYAQSRDAWLQADEIVKTWEDEFRTDPAKVFGDIGSYLINDRVRRYDGQDYEKVFLSANLALDHVLLGNTGNARIEIQKTFERETLIKNFREQEYDKISDDEKKQGLSFSVNDLAKNGYPLDQLESPEVLALKNGYQNAFAHYLAGYFFEVKGEYSLAAPGYRNALALRPDSKLIQSKVDKVGKVKPGPKQADVLFVIESGVAPAWKSVNISLPIPINKEIVVTSVSFPRIVPDKWVFVPASLSVGGSTLPVETIVNVDALAHRQLKDQLPGIVKRTAIRAVLKTLAQYETSKKAGKFAGLLASGASVISEQADERSWRSLPSRVSIARAILPVGELPLEFTTDVGTYRGTVNIDEKLTIIPIRLVDGAVYVGQKGLPFED